MHSFPTGVAPPGLPLCGARPTAHRTIARQRAQHSKARGRPPNCVNADRVDARAREVLGHVQLLCGGLQPAAARGTERLGKPRRPERVGYSRRRSRSEPLVEGRVGGRFTQARSQPGGAAVAAPRPPAVATPEGRSELLRSAVPGPGRSFPCSRDWSSPSAPGRARSRGRGRDGSSRLWRGPTLGRRLALPVRRARARAPHGTSRRFAVALVL
jgi:hypothetical protein